MKPFGVEFTFLADEKRITKRFLDDLRRKVGRSNPVGTRIDDIGVGYYQNSPHCLIQYDHKFLERFSDCDVQAACGAIEVPSPIFQSEDDLRRFWQKKLVPLMRRFRLTPRVVRRSGRIETHIGTGGGHVHVARRCSNQADITALTEQVDWINIFRWQMSNPWVAWAMNEFGDDTEAVIPRLTREASQVVWSDAVLHYLPSEKHPFISVNDPFRANNSHKLTSINSQIHLFLRDTRNLKGLAISTRHHTFEFRFFNAPRSADEALRHVRLAQAILNRCETLTDQKALYWPKRIDLLRGRNVGSGTWRRWTNRGNHIGQLKAAFKESIEELGLPWKDYSSYASTIEDRYRYGVLN